jgi:hypothetical protein
MDAVVLERINELEDLMAEVLRLQARTQLQVEQTSRELREFKREMQDFKREMREDSRRSKEENDKSHRQLRQEIATISHKMGTLAEDFIAPSIPGILKEVVNCVDEPTMVGVRIRKRLADGRSQEYDVLAICGDYLLINETKSRLQPEDIPAFVERLQEVRTFLPEYAEKQIIGSLSTFYVDPSLVIHGERQGLLMLGIVDGLLELLNTPELQLRSY